MAANKYLVHSFGQAFFDYVKSKLDVKSSCLIYDQLAKIGEREEIRLAEVRTMVIENIRETIRSEDFTQIDQETLISLLSLDQLSIDEVDLLTAVWKWVGCEVQRQGLPVNRPNRRWVFKPIKHYVLFTALEPETAAYCKVIADLLTLEEAGSLLLHLNQGEPFVIEQKTSRSVGSGGHSVFVSDLFSAEGESGSRTVELTVNRRVSIRAIHLTYSRSAANLGFQVLNNLTDEFLNLNVKRSVKDGMLCLSLSPPLELEADQTYTLYVDCSRTLGSQDQLTNDESLSYGPTTFKFDPQTDNNFVRGLEFVPLD